MTHLLTALLALATGWCWGHLTARVHLILVAGTPAQDEAAFLADERARFDELVADLDLNDPKDEAA